MNYLKVLTAKRLKIGLVAIPTVAAALYFGLFAPDRYVSESTVALKSAGSDSSGVAGAAMLLAGLSSPSREDTLYLREYLGSWVLLKQLDAKLHLRKHFEATFDPFSRLAKGASQEAFLDYFRNHVDVQIDDLSSTITVRTQGFTPEFAHRLNEAVLQESDLFINELSHKLARDRLSFAEGELARVSQRLESAKADVLAFQNKHHLLDATEQARANGALVAQLEASVSKYEAELRQLRTFMNDDAYQVQALRSQLDATRAQLAVEKNRGTGGDVRNEKLNTLAIEFQGLEMKAQFALDTYKLALAAVENARIDATRKLKSVVIIDPPTLPETAEYPRRIYDTVTVLVVCLLLYGIARLVGATIREHQD